MAGLNMWKAYLRNLLWTIAFLVCAAMVVGAFIATCVMLVRFTSGPITIAILGVAFLLALVYVFTIETED